jgi:hypothetical protein
MTRSIRNKEVLRQAEERAKKKKLCLASEMRDNGEEVDVVAEGFNCFCGGYLGDLLSDYVGHHHHVNVGAGYCALS